jgi:hypothetical protein
VFHGIASPRFPASSWMTHRMWGRYTQVDFLALRLLAESEMYSVAD